MTSQKINIFHPFFFVASICCSEQTPPYIDMSGLTNAKGEFIHRASSFRKWVSKDGSSGFPAESGRYHLYVSLACPFAHRTLIVRRLKGLNKVITVDVVDIVKGTKGWKFDSNAAPDTVNGTSYLSEIYFMADKEYQVS